MFACDAISNEFQKYRTSTLVRYKERRAITLVPLISVFTLI